MKQVLDYRLKAVVDAYDEVSLWAAPFALKLLQNIPLLRKGTVVDLGFGTGFPLLELSQRFGENVEFIGLDIWQEAIDRTKQKIKLLELKNIHIDNQSAEEMAFEKESIDMFCSNLGIGNFKSATRVFEKVFQYLKPRGALVFTTNDDQTFKELFNLFNQVFDELSLDKNKLVDYLKHRRNSNNLQSELESTGFIIKKHETSEFYLRFASAKSLFDHSIVRIAFRNEWMNLVSPYSFDSFTNHVSELIECIIKKEGEFRISVPVHYFHFIKP